MHPQGCTRCYTCIRSCAEAAVTTMQLSSAQAPYSPTSNPFGVRPRTRTPAGSLAAARRDSGGLPASVPPFVATGATLALLLRVCNTVHHS